MTVMSAREIVARARGMFVEKDPNEREELLLSLNETACFGIIMSIIVSRTTVTYGRNGHSKSPRC